MDWLAAGSFDADVSVGDLIAGIGLIGAIVTLLFTTLQLKANRNAQQGQFLLHLHDQFQRFDVIHRSLVNREQRSNWHEPPGGDWPSLVQYMGLFERCEVLIDQDLLDPGVFDRLYGYRLRNLVAVAVIRDDYLLHAERRDGWVDFLALWHRLDAIYAKRTGRLPENPASRFERPQAIASGGERGD